MVCCTWSSRLSQLGLGFIELKNGHIQEGCNRLLVLEGKGMSLGLLPCSDTFMVGCASFKVVEPGQGHNFKR